MFDRYLKFAKEIALEAGNIMLKYYNGGESHYKEDNTIVTIADKEINDYLIERVKIEFPEHSVDGEESDFGDTRYKWICDPIDGTAMYARHIPTCVFSLALVVDGTPLVAVVYDPFNKDLYSAVKGQGAYKNEIPIKVNNDDFDNMKSIINLDTWPFWAYDMTEAYNEINKYTYSLSLGSVARACMCVASGEFVAAVFPGGHDKYCDVAAAKLIIEEAGGVVTNLFGYDQRYDQDIKGVIASNKVVYNKILEIVSKYVKE